MRGRDKRETKGKIDHEYTVPHCACVIADQQSTQKLRMRGRDKREIKDKIDHEYTVPHCACVIANQ